MVNRDKATSFTIEQLKQQYNLDNKEITRIIERQNGQLQKIENELNNTITSIMINLGELLESQGDISLWFFSGMPTKENQPYIDWQDPSEHEGDLYYDRDTGLVYKFINDEWLLQRDEDLSIAMALTNTQTDISDSERKVFFNTPIPPYSSGDWWIKEDGTLYICQVGKDSGDYEESDFIIFNKYQNAVATKDSNKLIVLSGRVTTVETGIDEVRTTMEENKYYEDEEGNKHLISETVSENKQSIDEIKSQISGFADVTVEERTTTATMTLENINISEPFVIKVYPIGENISYLYPSSGLYPSDNLFSKTRILRFHNTTKNENTDFLLPSDLLYYDSENYDEFNFNYYGRICQIIKRCGYNSDRSVYVLDEAVTIDYEFPEGDKAITLDNGDYTISLLGYNTGYIYTKLMKRNEYTSQLTTQVNMHSAIKQTKNEITLEVEQATDREQLVSKINLVPGEIKMEGYISANENFKIDEEGNMYAKHGSFSGNVYLEEGGAVIGGNGILTNMQYIGISCNTSQLANTEGVIGSTGGGFLGLSGDNWGRTKCHYYKTYHACQVFIPQNFTVKEAYVTVIHSPTYYNNSAGYVRNLKVYNITNYFGTGAVFTNNSYFLNGTPPFNSNIEISGAFGTNGKTFSNSTKETATSADISRIFTKSGNYTIAVASDISVPADTTNFDITKIAPYTGFASVFVNIIGYMRTN